MPKSPYSTMMSSLDSRRNLPWDVLLPFSSVCGGYLATRCGHVGDVIPWNIVCNGLVLIINAIRLLTSVQILHLNTLLWRSMVPHHRRP